MARPPKHLHTVLRELDLARHVRLIAAAQFPVQFRLRLRIGNAVVAGQRGLCGVNVECRPRGIVQPDLPERHGPYDLGAYEIRNGNFSVAVK